MNLNLIDDNELAVMVGKVLKHLMAALHVACLLSWYLILSYIYAIWTKGSEFLWWHGIEWLKYYVLFLTDFPEFEYIS